MSVKKYLGNKLEDLQGRKVLVTGPTSGIGLALVKHLLYKHASVVFLARNKKKSDSIIEELKQTYPEAQIDFVLYDQSKEEIIDSAINEIEKNHLDMYALVCNAGIINMDKSIKDEKGRPITIGTNYFGLRYFLDNLLPILSKQNNEYKIILQGSLVAKHQPKKNVDITSNKYSMLKQYAISKSCIEIYFDELATNYHKEHSNISFMCCEPGITSTDIIREFKQPIRTLGKWFMRIFSHKVDKAALTAYRCLETTSVNGDYYVPRGFIKMLGYPKKKKFKKR